MLLLKALAPTGTALLLTACASAPAPDYPLDHPANPAATIAPASPPASAITSYVSPSPASTMPAADSPQGSTSQPEQKEEDPHAGHH
jgi:hypothetical protein